MTITFSPVSFYVHPQHIHVNTTTYAYMQTYEQTEQTQMGQYITAMRNKRENAAGEIYVKTRLERWDYSGLPEDLLKWISIQ